MKRWEKIKEAMDNPSKTVRAKFMFEIMEEERKIGVELFKDQNLSGLIKLAIKNHDMASKYKKSKPIKENDDE